MDSIKKHLARKIVLEIIGMWTCLSEIKSTKVYPGENETTSAQCSKTIERGGQKSKFGLNGQLRGQIPSKSSVELIFDTFGEV